MDYIKILKYGNIINVSFYIEQDKVFNIGEEMNKLCKDAYMNGYNWEAFLTYYFEKNCPEILEGIDFDPEAGMFSAYYDLTPENEVKATKFEEVIVDLIENEEKLYEVVKTEAKNIEWD